MLRHGCGASRCKSGASREPSRPGEPGLDAPRAGERGAAGAVGAEADALEPLVLVLGRADLPGLGRSSCAHSRCALGGAQFGLGAARLASSLYWLNTHAGTVPRATADGDSSPAATASPAAAASPPAAAPSPAGGVTRDARPPPPCAAVCSLSRALVSGTTCTASPSSPRLGGAAGAPAVTRSSLRSAMAQLLSE